ncbi:MAG: glycerol dehydrogenase [Candidatus Melainabacteria bacterium]|nr:glycerol dehydrogenase [Candidatus Melainabacteria bacterium]
MHQVFCSPARYVQGRDATLNLGLEMVKLGIGGKSLILASPSAIKFLTAGWQESFSKAEIDYSVEPFSGECSRNEIARVVKIAVDIKAEVIIGAGGGKVLDAARAVACELQLPVVNCPTAASSDAPCSALSVVYSEKGEFETYLFYKRNPDLVLVDTAVVAKAPPRLLSSGMGDALATWFEAKTVIDARKANQVGGATTISAQALAKLCYETLIADGRAALTAAEHGTVTAALERIVEANTLLSGLGFESGGLAIAHSVHNGLTAVPETHSFMHGEKVAFGLIVQLIAEGKPQSVIDEVLDFSHSVNLPISLPEVGLKHPSVDVALQIAERAVAEGETAHNEPFVVTAPMIADAILAADAIGRRHISKSSEHKLVSVR